MAVGSQQWKTLEIKFEELHDLVVVRHQDEHFPEWSVDTFHNVIYNYNIGRWLSRHEKAVKQLSEGVLKNGKFQCNVCPSNNITEGKCYAKERGFQVKMATTSSRCGFTMASPTWLILYLLFPNCRLNSRVTV